MPLSPEQQARQNIDQMLAAAGWIVQNRKDANPTAGRGVAIREFPMKSGFGEADYLLYVDGMAVGVIEAKKEGSTLTGFELQTEKLSLAKIKTGLEIRGKRTNLGRKWEMKQANTSGQSEAALMVWKI